MGKVHPFCPLRRLHLGVCGLSLLDLTAGPLIATCPRIADGVPTGQPDGQTDGMARPVWRPISS